MPTLAGIDKMKKAELVELCEEHGIDPPKSVADMRYKLKRMFDDDDDDDDDESDSSSSEPVKKPTKKPVKKSKPDVGTLKQIKGEVVQVKNDSSGGKKIIVHSVAQGLTWSQRGTMGRITTTFGKEPQVQYNGLRGTLKLGTVQFVPVGGNITIASVVAQSPGADRSSIPPFDSKAFVKTLKHIADRALRENASVHIASPDPRTPGFNADDLREHVEKQIVQQGVDVTVYGKPATVVVPEKESTPSPPPPPAAESESEEEETGFSYKARRKHIANLVKGKKLDDFPLKTAKATLTKIPKDTEEFWDLEERFAAHLQGRNEDYVSKRIKKGLKPMRFILIDAERVSNEVLEARFDLKKQELIKSRGAKEIRERVSFHGTHPRNCQSICNTSLLRFKHELNPCKKQVDDGYFGTNKKGVYVSRYADYTLKYANNIVALEPKDIVKTIIFRTLPGKSKHITKLCGAIDPTDGYDSHSSPEFLEWYLFDEAQLCPEYVLHVRAEEDTRTMSDDQ
eukprot:TRINITY_DN1912_c4_g1_i1.p1 TRINITY_DN1912_c4_g1~~TRINITY_DN1912_c4_g1_i1.p1  ORF type:complete len:538 (+),score=103.83 TRINITY_DN1912_c4_g1_i1:87-1616(+)